jgi:type II secretory pathway component GspD/PulD (secretin)
MQVLIEAHILEVLLEDDTKHGVNLDAFFRVANSGVSWEQVGFADPLSRPSFFIDVDGTDLQSLIELLKTTTDAKTLASPKVLAVNGQEAKIQIGSQLGFFVTTTTQTSTLQSVDFLDVGVVLRVTPIISQDGRVLMHVKPEVSGGRINPETGLPEEDTTEVETTVMLNDGNAMVIGGLIQEELTDTQSKIPYLGDLWVVGRLFQRRNLLRQRSEIIVALVPRILPYDPNYSRRQEVELSRVETRLTHGDLQRVDRRAWEPQLRDAILNPIPILPRNK